MNIRILWAGKTRKDYYRSALDDYAGRIRKLATLQIVEVREESLTDQHSSRRIRRESKQLMDKASGTTVVLDSTGKMMTSEEFSRWLHNITGNVDFILGGPAGLDVEKPSLRLSFGKITLPHELARVVLLEQIYRALTIQHRIPYHK